MSHEYDDIGEQPPHNHEQPGVGQGGLGGAQVVHRAGVEKSLQIIWISTKFLAEDTIELKAKPLQGLSRGAQMEQLLVAENIQVEESLKIGFECPKHFSFTSIIIQQKNFTKKVNV